MQLRQFRPWCLGWVGANICGPQLPAGGDFPHVGLNLYSAMQSALLLWLLTAEEFWNYAPQMCVGTLQMSIRKLLEDWGGDKSEMTMCWHSQVDIHPSFLYKTEGLNFLCRLAQYIPIVTCVQIIESTSESISFGDALESSRGKLDRHRKPFTSLFQSDAGVLLFRVKPQGFSQK